MKKSIKAPFLLLMLLLLLLRFLAHFHDYMNEKRLMTLHIMYKEMRKFTILSSALKPIFFFFIYFFSSYISLFLGMELCCLLTILEVS